VVGFCPYLKVPGVPFGKIVSKGGEGVGVGVAKRNVEGECGRERPVVAPVGRRSWGVEGGMGPIPTGCLFNSSSNISFTIIKLRRDNSEVKPLRTAVINLVITDCVYGSETSIEYGNTFPITGGLFFLVM